MHNRYMHCEHVYLTDGRMTENTDYIQWRKIHITTSTTADLKL